MKKKNGKEENEKRGTLRRPSAEFSQKEIYRRRLAEGTPSVYKLWEKINITTLRGTREREQEREKGRGRKGRNKEMEERKERSI